MRIKKERHPYGYDTYMLPKVDFDKFVKAAKESSPEDGADMRLKVEFYDYGCVFRIGGLLFSWEREDGEYVAPKPTQPVKKPWWRFWH